MKKSVYIVEDDMFYATILNEELKGSGIVDTQLFYDAESFLTGMADSNPDIVLLDHKLGEHNGIDLLKKIKQINENIDVIFLSGQEDVSVAVKALKFGAYDYVEKNASAFARVKRMVKKIKHFNKVVRENQQVAKLKRYTATAVAAFFGILIFLNLKFPHIFEGL